MAVFTYKATDLTSGDRTGSIAADTPRQARDLLRDRGLVIRDICEAKAPHTSSSSAAGRRIPRGRRGLRHQSTIFIRELSTLLAVGVPLLDALQTIADQHRGQFKTCVLLLRDNVAAGSSLATAMRGQPEVFDELAVNLTEVGEDAGTLDTSLERLADFRERADQLRGKIATALIYPAIVIVTATFASIFLMTFVVPRIIEPLVQQRQALPLPTRVIKGASDFLVTWWPLVLGLILLVACGFVIAIRSPRGRLAWQRFVLRLPILGDLVRKQAIVRICIVLSTLLRSGIVFVRALQIAQRTTGNLVLRDALARCERAVTAGEEISDALGKTGAFPPMVVQIFSVGQQSGRLEEMLDRLAAGYDQQVQTSSQRIAAILEPVVIIFLAVVVLFIVLATVLPILEAGNAIG